MHVPNSTYRLQLTPAFGFSQAAGVVDYLKSLGIGDVYLAPIFEAKPGSTHGYDLVTMKSINSELGGEKEFESLARAATRSGMGIIQDVVPNHRAFHGKNRMLMDILENGPHARYYGYYDIDWNHAYKNIRGRLLAPFLGDFYGRCLERGEITFSFSAEGFKVHYYELALPLRITSYHRILEHQLDALRVRMANALQQFSQFRALIGFISRLDKERESAPDFDYGAFIKEYLWELATANRPISDYINGIITSFNQKQKTPEQYDLIDSIMAEQFFRLSYWKVGTEELNYRRFFSINDLIALRVEVPEVFEETHSLVFDLADKGLIQGLRVDHVDGLYNPSEYLERLRDRLPDAYIVVEKILEHGEELPKWPIHGTTGYEFMDAVANLLCDKAAADEMEQIYRGFANIQTPYEQMVLDNKRNIIGKHMAGDIDNLALMLKSITNRQRIGNDLTMYAVRRALVEILTHFSVYRTYVSPSMVLESDRKYLEDAIREAQRTLPLMKFELELIGSFLLATFSGNQDETARNEWIGFLMRMQQYTGPLMAKGVEDTTFFQYNRLIALNEVGSNPTMMGVSVDGFHAFNSARQRDWPHAMNGTSTHDAKRGEDARARILALADDPHAWREQVESWRRINAGRKTRIGERPVPAPNDEYHLYQALIGSAPLAGLNEDDFPRRFTDYLVKMVREGKTESSWLTPNLEYEKALVEFAKSLLDEKESAEFLSAYRDFSNHIMTAGMLNSLTQVLLKCMSPGVPDVYMGSELWNFSFVDPDNRREVDFAQAARLLEQTEARVAEGRANAFERLLQNPTDGAVKQYVLRCCLRLREAEARLFADGEYVPISVSGDKADHVIAFARVLDGRFVLVITTRLMGKIHRDSNLLLDQGLWNNTIIASDALAGKRVNNVFTDEEHEISETVSIGRLLGRWPVGVYLIK